MDNEFKPVNLPGYIPEVNIQPTSFSSTGKRGTEDYHDIFNRLVGKANTSPGTALPVIPSSQVDTSGRYPTFYTGLDNEDIYAQTQSFGEKAYNGVAKMVGIGGATFLNGTVGLVNGLYEWGKSGKFNSFYNNDLSNSLNDYTESLNDSLAFYKTQRQRDASWWEPENLFSGNMLFDNIISNLGFALGAGAAGVAVGGLIGSALKGIGSAAGLISTGAEGAATVNEIIGSATALTSEEALGATTSRLSSAWNAAKTKIGNGILSSDKAIKAISATAGEAGIEALNNSREYRQNMINEYASKYGVAPTGKDLEDINKSAESVGNASFALNSVLLTATNYVMLPKIFSSSFKSERTLLNNIAREAGDYVSTIPQKGLGKYLYGASKGLGTLFSATEAAEEGAQYAIQRGTQEYFGRKNRGEDTDIVRDMLGFGIKEALTTDEGLLNTFVGGLSGGLMTMGIFGKGQDGKYGFGKGGTIEQRGLFGFGGQEAKIRETAIPDLNKTSLKNKLLRANGNISAAQEIQEERAKKIAEGDKFEAINLETDYANAFIDTRIAYGAEELIYDEINEMRQAANTDFTSLQKSGIAAPLDDKESFLRRLDNFEKQAKLTEKISKDLESTYGTMVDDKGKRLYPDSVLRQLSYYMVKVNDFTNRISGMNAKLAGDNIFLDEYIDKTIKEGDLTTEERNNLLNSIINIPNQPDSYKIELIGLVSDSLKAARYRKAYLDQYNKVFQSPEQFAAPEETETEKKEGEISTTETKEEKVKGPTLNVATERGDVDLEIGKEYYVGKVDEDEKGKKVFDFPKFTLLGKNEDGTIKIQLPNGAITSVPADKFKKYKLGSVESAEKNKKAKYWMEHANDVYTFNFGKAKGGKVKGRLEYDLETDQLLFKYVNKRTGKIDKIVLNREHFKAKSGFKNAILEKVGQVNASQQKVFDEFVNDTTPDPAFLEKVATLPGVLEVIFDETIQSLEDTKELIENKREELTKIEQDLVKLTAQVEGPKSITEKTKRFKATTHKTLQAIAKLTKTRDQLKDELLRLEAEQEELEIRLEDVVATAEHVRNQPGDYRDMYKSLLAQRDGLQDAILETGLQINRLSELTDEIEKVLAKAWNAANKLVNKFFDKYPNVPVDRIGIIDFLNKNLEANKAEREEMQRTTSYAEAEKILPYTAVAGNLLEDIHKLDAELAAIDEIDVTPNQVLVEELRDNIAGLLDKLKAYETQVASKTGTLAKLKELYKVHKEQLAIAKQLQTEKELKIQEVKDEFLGSGDNSVPSVNYDGDYELDPKKSKENLIKATIAISKQYLNEGEKLAAHHVRSNTFGFKFNSLPNKSKIRAVLVSKANESELGLDGMIEKIGGHDRTVVAVMVLENADGSVIPVDVDGNAITNSEERIDKGIYQTMPDPKLSTKAGTMFRESDSEFEEDYRAAYSEMINNTLKTPSLNTYKVIPSFGFPEKSTYPDQFDSKGRPKVNYNATNSVVESGLIDESALGSAPVIYVPTTNPTAEKGSTRYEDAAGRIFLDTGEAYIPMNNKQLGKESAEVIYQAVLRLATLGKIKGNTEAGDIISWLRTVIYWGTPKNDISYNSLFFEDSDDGLMLRVSGKGYSIPFTPTSIKANKEELTALLSEMYHNVNSRLTGSASEYNKPYTEILSISEDGKMTTKVWPNYQTYLLSDKDTDGSSRSSIPLTTNIRPLESNEDINREGIYFILDTLSTDQYLKKAATAAPKRAIGQTAQPATSTTPVTGKYKLDGTEETITLMKGKVSVTFTADKDDFYDDNGNAKVSIAITEGNDVLLDKYKTQDQVNIAVAGYIAGVLAPIVDEYINAKEAAVVTTPAPSEVKLIDGQQSITILGGKVGINFEINSNDLVDDEGNVKLISVEVATQEGMQELRNKFPEASDEELIQKVASLVASKVKSIIPIDEEAALSTPVTEEKSVLPDSTTIGAANELFNDPDPNNQPTKEYRLSVTNATESKLDIENWDEFEAWLGKAFPNIPVYRTKQMIQAANGRQAWGMFQNGAIYIYENAITGTGYHEVFEAIWSALVSAKEKSEIYKEFKQRKGTFFDRESMKEVEYSKATEAQIKERIADEFADHVVSKRSPKSLLEKIFDEIINFFKTFFFGDEGMQNTEKLFAKINNGYYAKYNPFESKLSFSKAGVTDINKAIVNGNAEYRYALMGFTDVQWNDLMQQMTYYMVSSLLYDPSNPNKSIFDVNKTKENSFTLYSKLYGNLLYDLQSQVKVLNSDLTSGKMSKVDYDAEIGRYTSLWENIKNNWESIQESHKTFLLPYEIEFDENDEAILRNEDNSGKEDYKDANKVDAFRKAPTALKLFLATLPVVNTEGVVVRSTVNGIRLQPLSKVRMDIQNAVKNVRNPDEFIGKLKELAKNNISYKTLYDRITFGIPNFSLDKLSHASQTSLITGLWSMFKKTDPTVKYVYILSTGEVIIGDSNFTTATGQVLSDYEAELQLAIRDPKNDLFTYKGEKSAAGYYGNPKALGEKPNDLDSSVKFLKRLGIVINKSVISKNKDYKNKIITATTGIYDSIKSSKKIATVSAKALDIKGRLREIAEVEAIVSNPEFDATYYNINGEMTQSFIGPNIHSDLYDSLSQIDNLNELEGTKFQYLMTGGDVFSQNSVIINRMFDRKTGKKKVHEAELMKNGYVDGLINESNNRRSQASKFSRKNRFIAQLNLLLKGYQFNLVPGDGSMEHMTYLGNVVSVSETGEVDSISKQLDVLLPIFKGYFIDEVNVSRENRPIVKPKDSGRTSQDLRFFKGMLSSQDHQLIINDTSLTPEKLYDKYKDKIEKAVKDYLEFRLETLKESLSSYGIYNEDGADISFSNLANIEEITKDQADAIMHAIVSNYAIGTIELHKLIYSDPYFYKDELKRIKNFNSPHTPLAGGSANLNAAFNKAWNKSYSKGDIGYTDFSNDALRTVVLEDIVAGTTELDYEPWEEGDGGGFITFKGLRKVRIAAGDWSTEDEEQYKYDIAFEKMSKGLFDQMSPEEEELLGKYKTSAGPGVQSAYTPYKPKTAGNKNDGKPYNDIMLDKFALYPLSYRILTQINPDANIVKFYDRMQADDIDYAVFASGRKVGQVRTHPLYNKGQLIMDNFGTVEDGGITVVPMTIFTNQSDVPTKETSTVTTGSQSVKLMTLDLMEVGVPVDFETDESFEDRYDEWFALSEEQKLEKSTLYKEIKNNQRLIEAMIENGIDELMDELGVVVENNKYSIPTNNRIKAYESLRRAMLSREVNDNVIDSLADFLNGSTLLEATPAYRQVRDILYSIADSRVVSRKMTGGQKVQIPASLYESVKAEPVMINGKMAYQSDTLKFYNDIDPETGKPIKVAEVMVRRWFDSPMSDEELLKYLNNTPEGQKILKGIAYRIPTQKQNSIEVFRIAKFLPKEFGDVVIIPSALVRKVGSDFDIDKLFMYFKNVYLDSNKKPVLVPFFGYGKEGIENATRFHDSLSKDELTIYSDLFRAFNDPSYEDELLDTLGDREKRERTIKRLYRESLQNAYVESSENLVSSDYNYDQLIKPNSADELKDLTDRLLKDMGKSKPDYSKVDTMLSLEDMLNIRYNLVTGKYAIGIAAQAQTNHSLRQKTLVGIDLSTAKLSADDAKYIGDGKIRFEKYNTATINGKTVPTLSKIKDANNKDYISDTNGMFIDGYVDISKDDWIMQMGATPEVVSTYLFLIDLGIPKDDVVYFMNQPIIREYLQGIENAGYKYLYIDDFVKDQLAAYNNTSSAVIDTVPKFSKLQDMIRKDKLTEDDKLAQQFILREFLKYSKMAEQLFRVVQGTNFDTASFNDPFLVFKKQLLFNRAKDTIFTGVDELLKESFLGTLGKGITDIRNIIAQILTSDQGQVRVTLEKVLTPYIDLPDRQFIRVAQTAVADLFDWAVQNDLGLNKKIESILVDRKGTADQVMEFFSTIKEGHPLYQNAVVEALASKPASKENQANNLYIKNKANKVYDQNRLIYGFEQLKNYLVSQGRSDLYNNIVDLSILQSGLKSSFVSFTSLLPYEDFKNKYAETLSYINDFTNLDKFIELNVFERNNWNNTDIVDSVQAYYVKSINTYNPNMGKFLPTKVLNAVMEGKIPAVVQIPIGRDLGDVITYSWTTGTSAEKRAMRKNSDYSYIKKGLFKRVYIDEKTPLTRTYVNKKGKEYTSYVYKMINALGEGARANEFYLDARPSVFDNGYQRVEERTEIKNYVNQQGQKLEKTYERKYSGEVSDDVIVDVYEGNVQDTTPPTIEPIEYMTIAMQPDNVEKILSGEKTTTLRTDNLPSGVYNIGGRLFNLTNKGLLSVQEAGGVEAITKSEAFAKTGPKYPSTKEFLAGKRKLYVLDIKPTSETNIDWTEENNTSENPLEC